MLYIYESRGQGKTTHLCYLSYATRAPIITHSKAQKKYITDLAESLLLDIPEPITVNELKDKNLILSFQKY